MKISVGIYPSGVPTDIIASARLADEMGFSTLWVLDSHLLFHEVYTLLGALAVSTERIRLGTAVTNPLTRHPTVTASAFSTLAELSGGRATLGISVGDSALKSMNFEVARMATLAETVALCRKLLRGEAVSCGEGTMAQLPRIAPPVPIYVAATGRKMLELAGRIADGVILMNGVAPELICEAVRIVRGGTRATEREQESVRIAVCMPSKPRCREVQCSARHPAQYSGARRRSHAQGRGCGQAGLRLSAAWLSASRLRAPHSRRDRFPLCLLWRSFGDRAANRISRTLRRRRGGPCHPHCAADRAA